jgi:alpha-tubulin suppressor-like RCC1 family protein
MFAHYARLASSAVLLLSALPACGGDDSVADTGVAVDATADAIADATPDAVADAAPDAIADAAPDAIADAAADAADGGDGGDGGGGDAGVPGLVTEQTMAAGNGHTCAISATDTVLCWGRNDEGQLGDGTTTDRPAPTEVPGLGGVVGLSGGHSHTCAVLGTGEARCWGENMGGQLGAGVTTSRQTSPIAVAGLTNVSKIESFWAHSCALLADGTVQCFGSNGGRLGDTTTATRRAPVAMDGVTDGVDVGVGWGHSCVARVTGGVRCTGTYNNWGQIGDGTTMDRLAVVDVLDVDDAVALGIGSYHSCAITRAGTVRCWGNNQTGALGIGAIDSDPHTAADVPGVTDVVQVRAGSALTCAITSAGALWCWGNPVGDGTTMTRSSPVEITSVTGAAEIVIGTDHACVKIGDGEIRCWGWNGAGQLGDGTTMDATAPVTVVGSPF